MPTVTSARQRMCMTDRRRGEEEEAAVCALCVCARACVPGVCACESQRTRRGAGKRGERETGSAKQERLTWGACRQTHRFYCLAKPKFLLKHQMLTEVRYES